MCIPCAGAKAKPVPSMHARTVAAGQPVDFVK
jgi:hypothetical protein